MASFLQSFLDPKKNWFAAQHMKSLSSRLRKYGLRYDDLYDPYYDLDIKEALNRLPKDVVDARNQRLKRAMDLSMKHQYLSEDLRRCKHPLGVTFRICLLLLRGRVLSGRRWEHCLFTSAPFHKQPTVRTAILFRR
ncbi:hypothetical protein MLD38_006023 [Melastoma candidum]|uniref:Uncharacterized protein n=1 Tax=Melastoma candidum TaxID=119954 RepID=A0ACB9RLK6_9MYRT|nr:hypothetical protein MLD38_006023 [Melastoma candidum]